MAGVSAREIKMAEQLVADMSQAWEPQNYNDTYRSDLLARVKQKVKAGQTELVDEPGEDVPAQKGAQIIHLMAALKPQYRARNAKGRSAAVPAANAVDRRSASAPRRRARAAKQRRPA